MLYLVENDESIVFDFFYNYLIDEIKKSNEYFIKEVEDGRKEFSDEEIDLYKELYYSLIKICQVVELTIPLKLEIIKFYESK